MKIPGESQALIIGAGIGGLAAAIALRQAGYAVRVFERAQELKEVGAGITLWPNAVKALRKLGLETIVDDSIGAQPDIYMEAGDHETLLHLTHAQFARLTANAPHGRFSAHD